MATNIRQFFFPAQAREAARLLAKLNSKAVVLAGGTRLTRALSPCVEAVVDISDLPLKRIKADKKWLRIGALCTIAELEKSPVLAKWARGVIAKTAGFGSNALARSMGTVGGNVVRAHPFNHLPPVFLALDAQAAYTDGRSEKTLPFADLLKPEVMRLFGVRVLLTEVRIPAETRSWAAAAQRLSATRTDWESVAHCVAAVDKKGGVCRKAAIALSAVLPRAARFEKAERSLAGQPCTEASAEAAAAEVVKSLAEFTQNSAAKAYACEVSGVLVRRALMEAFQP
ncbi:MAG: FAD binding domain-containing protein [Elusimicrobia bacterium]|nr:FAD binding domain-containing protein [Elusimicrobiota bacterium]